MWFEKKIETEALRYGRQDKGRAREDYAGTFGFVVTVAGFYVNALYAGLRASPDGLVFIPTYDSHGILEIKCPKILEHLLPTDLHELTLQQ